MIDFDKLEDEPLKVIAVLIIMAVAEFIGLIMIGYWIYEGYKYLVGQMLPEHRKLWEECWMKAWAIWRYGQGADLFTMALEFYTEALLKDR